MRNGLNEIVWVVNLRNDSDITAVFRNSDKRLVSGWYNIWTSILKQRVLILKYNFKKCYITDIYRILHSNHSYKGKHISIMKSSFTIMYLIKFDGLTESISQVKHPASLLKSS